MGMLGDAWIGGADAIKTAHRLSTGSEAKVNRSAEDEKIEELHSDSASTTVA